MDNIYSAYHYSCKTKADREAIEALAPKVLEAADKAAFGNIGDVKYTTRTTAPNGGVWCDGSSYGKAEFPDVYRLLTEQKLQSVDIATYDNVVSTNGSCGLFGLDTVNESFKVPTLTNVYIKAGQAGETFGAESLPNITGEITPLAANLDGYVIRNNNSGSKSLSITSTGITAKTTALTTGSYEVGKITLNASKSSSTYKDGAKVNPNNVTYRAYVILYTAEKELSIVNWTQQLDQKTSEGLKQIDEAKNEAESITNEAITAITTAKNNAVSDVVNSGGSPVGTLVPFAGSSAPSGWLICDGAAISRTTYAALFSVIGTTYGAGDGSETFNIPNYTNARFVTSGTISIKGNGKALGMINSNNVLCAPNLRGTGDSNYFGGWTTYSDGALTASSHSASGVYGRGGVTTDASKSGLTGSASLASACRFIIKY